MRTILRFSWLALLVVGLSAPAALASKAESAKPQDGVMKVEDRAELFTASGIDTAKAKFDGTTFKSSTHLTVVTRNAVPDSKKKDFTATNNDRAKLKPLFADWAKQIAQEERATGILVLVYVHNEKFWVTAVADKAMDVHRNFTDANASMFERKLLTAVETAQKQTGDEAKKTRDAGLLEATSYVIDELKDTSLPADTKLKSDEKKETGGMSILGWVCIIGAVLLGVWILIALIRMMTGSVNGYGGGMGGGGGMGFMGGMMGGMFGAMAGMYLYDQFTGGHHYNDNYGGGSDGSGGGDTGGDSGGTGEGDFSGGSEGTGGGDWGDSGGGDTGGGGDWGGDSGGDFGGGGDW